MAVMMNPVVISRNFDTVSNQKDFCKMLFGGRKTVYTDSFFEVINIRKDVQYYYSDFDGLLHEMVSKNPFLN